MKISLSKGESSCLSGTWNGGNPWRILCCGWSLYAGLMSLKPSFPNFFLAAQCAAEGGSEWDIIGRGGGDGARGFATRDFWRNSCRSG